MKLLKRAGACLMAAALLASLAACHPKDETAMTIGDVQITSALYMCALISADGEGRNAVDEAKQAESSESGDTTSTNSSSTTDYYSEEIDGTDFSTWVRNRAEELCKQYAAYETRFAEAGLTLDEETQAEIDSNLDMLWNTYGYSSIYEPNGVSFETYTKYFTYQYKADEYFMSIYGQDGTDPVPEEEIKTSIAENYVAAETLTGAYTTTDSTTGSSTPLSDDEKTALKEKFEGYAQHLRDGESFETIYVEQNASPLTASEDGAQNPYISILGAEDTSYASDNFEEVKNMAVGEVKVLEDETYGLTLVVRQDILADSYYYDNLKDQALYTLKQEEFENAITEFGNSLTMEKSDFAINRFKPKNIKYPEGAY